MILLVITLSPLVAAILAFVVRSRVRLAGGAAAVFSLAPIVAAVILSTQVAAGTIVTGAGQFLRADALSTILILSIAVVSALASWLGPGMWGEEGWTAAQVRRF